MRAAGMWQFLDVGGLQEGKQVHVQIEAGSLEEDAVVGASLVDMYVKCGSLEDGRRVFDKLAERSVVAWNAMIGGYGQQGMCEEAVGVYRCMQEEGRTLADSITDVCLLQAYAVVAAVGVGEQLHAEIERRGLQANGSVGAALVNMYAKCGRMCDAQRVFDWLDAESRSVEAWNALVRGYARQGNSAVVFELVGRMSWEGRVGPDEITVPDGFERVQSCGVTGGRQGVVQGDDVRAGHERKGGSLQMHGGPFGACRSFAGGPSDGQEVATWWLGGSDVVWHALLGACEKWKDVEIGLQAFDGAMSVDERDGAAYAGMWNIYASRHMWEAAKEMRARGRKVGAWRKAGQSWWTDTSGVVPTFVAGEQEGAWW